MRTEGVQLDKRIIVALFLALLTQLHGGCVSKAAQAKLIISKVPP